MQKTFDVKIFATDSAVDSLDLARRGLFPAAIERDVSDDRLRRFFERSDDSCLIRKELREWVIFAPQNLLHDPPFFRVDLVSCRNFLIYLEEEAQRKVLALFHFALVQGGHLFLGPAETLGRTEGCSRRSPRSGGSTGGSGRPGTRSSISRSPVGEYPRRGGWGGRGAVADVADGGSRPAGARQPVCAGFGDGRPGHRVVYFHGGTDEYLAHPPASRPGICSPMARDGLRPSCAPRSRALRENRPSTVIAWMGAGGVRRPVSVTVSPVQGPVPAACCS